MRSYIFKICVGATISIFIALYAINLLRLENIISLESLYIIGYGGLFTYDFDSNIVSFARVLVPQFIIIYLLADFMYNDFKICSVYVFTRANKRKYWFLKKFLSLLFITSLYYMAHFVILLVMGFLNGFRVERFDVFIMVVVSSFVLHTLVGFLLVCSVNLLALKFGINFGYLCVLIFNTVFTMIPSVTYGLFDNVIIKILPSSNGMLLGHSNDFVKDFSERFGFDTIEGFSIIFSMTYFIVLILIIFYIGARWIETLDIINDNKEA
ncbi:MAG: hypothetical protein GX660_09445 [Clostridiaceae bacterium]|nr:hypothetical protein [Clostridiaceae bacterium]